MKRIFIFIFSSLVFFGGCKKDNEQSLYPEVEGGCEPTAVSFSVYVLPLVKNSCATVGCHVQGGSGNGIFENYDQIKAKVDNGSFKRRVVVDRDMPPSGNLSDCQIKTIEKWLDEGALNN